MPKSDAKITRLRALRKTQGLSMLELAAASGVSLGTIQKLETTHDHDHMDSVGIGKLSSIAEVLKCSMVDIYPQLAVPYV